MGGQAEKGVKKQKEWQWMTNIKRESIAVVL